MTGSRPTGETGEERPRQRKLQCKGPEAGSVGASDKSPRCQCGEQSERERGR